MNLQHAQMDVFRMSQMFKRTVEQTPKAYMEELDAQVDLDRKLLEAATERRQNNSYSRVHLPFCIRILQEQKGKD